MFSHNLKYNPSFRSCMDSKSTIFVAVGSLLVMAIFNSITNFVSAEINCYSSGEKYICIFTSDDPPATAITFCNSDGTNCKTTWLDKVPPLSPAYKAALRNLQLTPDNTDPTSKEPLKEPGKLEMPDHK